MNKENPTYGEAVLAVEEENARLHARISEIEHENQRMAAAAIAHRACCGTEHDPANGKLHGCCVVCGVDWPCETAQYFIFKPRA